MRKVEGALLAALLAGTSALAQTAEPAPVRQSVDDNGVDLFRGRFNTSRQDVSMGTAQMGMSYGRIWRDHAWVDTYDIHLAQTGGGITVAVGGVAESFSAAGGGTYFNSQGGGSTLSQNGGSYTYTTGDGTVYQFESSRAYAALSAGDAARVTRITQPNGVVLTFDYSVDTVCTRSKPSADGDICLQQTQTGRMTGITSNLGYNLSFGYASDDTDTGFTPAYFVVSGVTMTNLASNARRSASYAYETGATDMAGRTWNYQISGNGITDIQRPGRGFDIHIDYYGGNGFVSAYRDPAGITTTYVYNDHDDVGERWVLVSTGGNANRVYVFDKATALMKRYTDENNLTTSYEYDGQGRRTKIVAQDGNSVEYQYDGRGNVVQTIAHAKPGSDLGDIVTSAGYEAGCSNPKTCNQPQWTRDARGNQTDYGYHGIGLVAAVALPAAANGVRPKISYDYAQIDGIWLPALVRSCRTAQPDSCEGSADQVVVDTGFGGSGQNYLPQWTRTRAGDGSVAASTSYGYDDVRNVTSLTDPNGQTSHMGYDAARRLVWSVAPDPDDGDWKRGKAVATTYNADGTVRTQQVGTANPDGGGFYEYLRTVFDYDGAGRKVSETLRNDDVAYALTQYGYDGLGRLDCTAVRMNPAAYANLPNACDLSADGGAGPDRIARTEYDAAGRVTRTWAGYRTSQAAHTDTQWTNNNRLERVIDPKGNATTYAYDGFDRPTLACFATPTCGDNGQGLDHEEYRYDASGNVTGRRLRDGNWMTYEHDALNRLTRQTPPGYTSRDQPTSYAYDNPGHVTRASIVAGNDMSVALGYDALGRLRREDEPFGSVDYGYDAAGNRTWIGYGDGYSVFYSYDRAGQMTDVVEQRPGQGQSLLAIHYHDELGRRVAIGRINNGAHSYYAYTDGAGRQTPWLYAMTHALAGSGALSTQYDSNAAGQIIRKSASNPAYGWTGQYDIARDYGTNALNQLTSSGGVNLGYDARGNLTSAPVPNVGGNAQGSGQVAYTYTADNLVQAAGGNPFNYDALGRMTMDQTANRLFKYAGSRLLQEYDYGGNWKARYVYGEDEAPLVRYDGGGYDTRRWLYADERGSVVAVADDGGNATAINRYDEYGIPAASNDGRFGYTGQAWNTTLGMWNYKARVYSPTLGRFLQTDPIGYGDGINWYNYVGGDPVNNTDPTGLVEVVGIDPKRAAELLQKSLNDLDSFFAPEVTVTARNDFGPMTGGFGSPAVSISDIGSLLPGAGSVGGAPTEPQKPKPNPCDNFVVGVDFAKNLGGNLKVAGAGAGALGVLGAGGSALAGALSIANVNLAGAYLSEQAFTASAVLAGTGGTVYNIGSQIQSNASKYSGLTLPQFNAKLLSTVPSDNRAMAQSILNKVEALSGLNGSGLCGKK